MNDPQQPPPPSDWAVLELMGHVRLAGRVSEEEKFGAKVGRIDVPVGETYVTQYFTAASIYRLTLVGEDVARAVAKNLVQPVPVSAWELPKQLAASPPPDGLLGDGETEDDDPPY